MSELVEELAKEVHNSWWQEKRRQGYVDYNLEECPICGSEIMVLGLPQSDVARCYSNSCEFSRATRKDMIPYEELAENIKELDRVTVRAVLLALNNRRGYHFEV